MKALLKICLSLGLAAAVSGPLHAIKITVPKQYEEQVQAIREAERAELAKQLEAAPSTGNNGLEFTVEGSDGESLSSAQENFLTESLDEAGRTAESFERSAPADAGFVSGQVLDKETKQPVSGVAIVIEGSDIGTIADSEGRYTLGPAPAGRYTLSFIKAGYIEANVTDFVVAAGEVSVFPFALPPRPAGMSDEVYVLQDFTVSAEEANQLMLNLDLRMSSDKMLNLFSAEDFSKFAAGDVADALKRVAGVNIVEGQFAVIRGLEDRYSSTTYNGAPVPSPDPDSQSVQLDLFPSEVVTNLEIAKTFAGDLPSNSSGGNINIVTHDYPDADLEIKVKAGTGFEDNAVDRFLSVENDSPIGREASTSDVVESDFSVFIGGRRDWNGREVRFKALAANEIDYRTKFGVFEQRSPDRRVERTTGPIALRGVTRSGDLAFGQLNLSDSGRWARTESERSEQTTTYLGLGVNLDKEGRHQIDASIFSTNKKSDTVELLENGFIPDRRSFSFFNAINASEPRNFGSITGGANPLVPVEGAPWIATPSGEFDPSRPGGRDSQFWFAPVFESTTFTQERALTVYQVNGRHELDFVDGLSFNWAANQAETTQDEKVIGIQYFFEPDVVPSNATLFQWKNDRHLPSLDELGSGRYVARSDIIFTATAIEETQDFVRGDVSYERPAGQDLLFKLDFGVFLEKADRSVSSRNLTAPRASGATEFVIIGDTPDQLGRSVLGALDVDSTTGLFLGEQVATNESSRDIKAVYFSGKTTFRERFDFLYGARLESINIVSDNDPFFANNDGTFNMFPNRVVLGRVIGSNDPLLNIDFGTQRTDFTAAERDEIAKLVNGEIDQEKFLPNLGFAYRPTDRLTLRAAWSKTVARPSFREMGYYTTAIPGSGDRVLGNPKLQLSNNESLDLRAEYTWGGAGDLVAVSLFKKTIQDPIEQFRLRNPVNRDELEIFRTFSNNPNEADLEGIEFEFRKSLSFIELPMLNYLSVGGNFTYIDAEIERSAIETAGSDAFFGTRPDETAQFQGIRPSRRLFGQPEWIANLDLTFDQPDWGTKVTLAWFSISDILDAAGSVSLNQRDLPTSMTLDRYTASFEQLDLIISQKWGSWTFGLSIKNLTDSERAIIYDPDQTAGVIQEQAFKVGRDYSISASYTW